MSSSIITTSAVSLAAVDPLAPKAIPTSADVSTGASFTPSPTNATGRFFIDSIATSLSAGKQSALTFDMPSCLAIALAVVLLSPVTIRIFFTPSFLIFASIDLVSGLIASSKLIDPITVPSTATSAVVSVSVDGFILLGNDML